MTSQELSDYVWAKQDELGIKSVSGSRRVTQHTQVCELDVTFHGHAIPLKITAGSWDDVKALFDRHAGGPEAKALVSQSCLFCNKGISAWRHHQEAPLCDRHRRAMSPDDFRVTDVLFREERRREEGRDGQHPGQRTVTHDKDHPFTELYTRMMKVR